MYRIDRLSGRAARRMIFGFALIALAVLVHGCVTVTDSGVPEMERRAAALNKSLMCPVCPGESIDQAGRRAGGSDARDSGRKAGLGLVGAGDKGTSSWGRGTGRAC